MKIGYIRISTADQNTARQELLMEQLGVDEVYIDRMSGKNTNRPELKKMMEYVRRGDTVIVESISRFARNTRDLLELVEKLSAKGVEFVSKKETIDTTTPTGKFMLTVFGAVAELEREYILQRQREGIAIAKANGGIVVYNEKDAKSVDEEPCIRCARCVQACPMGLDPYKLKHLCDAGNLEGAKANHVMDCILCGCCSYACPSRRWLTAAFKNTKDAIAAAARRK